MSSENEDLADNGDKSPNEWPSLNDICNHDRRPFQTPSSSRNEKSRRKRNKLLGKESAGYDSSKENVEATPSTSGRGARKKAASKPKWVPIPIECQPYKKRGNGRQYFDSNRANHNERQNESNEYANGYENGRGHARGNTRFRGKRGRGYSNWRPRREETSRGEVENASPDLTYDAECYYNSTVFYDPYMHNVYATVVRDKELKEAIKYQIEYYFSEENLVKDIYLRRKMDKNGYVPLTLIATFRRVKHLTANMDTIVGALKFSSKLELLNNAKVRPVVNPLKWPLPDTFVGLRTDVPEFFPGQPYMNALVSGMDNMNFTVDVTSADSFSETPDSASLSPNVSSEMAIPYFAESETPPEHMNSNPGSSVDPYVANGFDNYSNTTAPDKLANGFDYYNVHISNSGMHFTTNAYACIDASFNHGSSPDEVLSSETDISAESH